MTQLALDMSATLRVGHGDHQFCTKVSLQLERGILVLFGPSGSGKTLTIKALAGLLKPDAGHIRTGNTTLFEHAAGAFLPTHRRQIGYVPQHHALFPFKNVLHNIVFGLPRNERHRENPSVRELIEELDLQSLLEKRPVSLSGGERQRVALARALVMKPKLLLLDEPFASLDEGRRNALGHLVRRTLDRRETPAVFVTHNRAEALRLADRVAIYERGQSTVVGNPGQLLLKEAEVLIEGQPEHTDATDDVEQVAVRLQNVTLQGPRELLTQQPDGTATLRLLAALPPQSKANAPESDEQ